ncbi:polysaccharide biosynthesis tyrosine autokinase [Thermodesulfobacteriota bacterium]
MGKISDALERQIKEKEIKVDRIPASKPTNRPPTESFQTTDVNSKLITLYAPDSIDAENFKLLRSQILFSRERRRPRIILVTSAFPGEGKSFVSANLAVSIALGIEEYVLLLDCDLRRPHIHEMLSLKNTYGLHEYLTGKMSLPDLIIHTPIEKLSVLLAGTTPSNPIELLSSSTMKAFLEEVKGRYDDRYIVIDSTPLQVTAETNILANFVDGIIFVVMAHRAPRADVLKAAHKLGKEKILGIVFNGYEQAHKRYYQYYKKYYDK